MFISKKTHLVELSKVEKEYIRLLDMQKLGHESEVRALEARIEDLKQLVFIPKAEPHTITMEADAVISGSEKPTDISEAEQSALLAGARELDLLISGNYDNDLLDNAS